MRTHLRWDAQPSVVGPGTGPPSGPGWVTSIAQDGQAIVSWAPPTGGPPQTYTITPFIAGTPQASTTIAAPATSTTVTGLTNGTAYTFQVTATNQAGTAVSPMSGANTPQTNLLFGDEFNGTQLDPAWTPAYRDGDQSNSEQQFYLPQQVQLDGASNLVITTVPNPVSAQTYNDATPPTYRGGGLVTRPFLSGMVAMSWPGALAPSTFTQPGFNFTYGRIQVNAIVGQGTNGWWPAIWMLGANCGQTTIYDPNNVGSCLWPSAGSEEIDIAEFNNNGANYNAWMIYGGGGTLHSNGQAIPVTSPGTTFHTYECRWFAGTISWYLDGSQVVAPWTTSVPSTPQFMMIQNVIRGGLGTPSLTQPVTKVDWVRIFSS